VAVRRFSPSNGTEGGFTGGGSFPEPYLSRVVPPVPDPVLLNVRQLLVAYMKG